MKIKHIILFYRLEEIINISDAVVFFCLNDMFIYKEVEINCVHFSDLFMQIAIENYLKGIASEKLLQQSNKLFLIGY